MRYLGSEFTGKGATVALIDSGVNVNDPRLAGMEIEGWSIESGSTSHALLRPEFEDENGHGTEMAAAVARVAPECKLLAVKIMGKKLRTSAELMAAGIETAARHGADVVNLSLGTPNMGKALFLRDCCDNAVQLGSIVIAAAHPKGERAYPADLPETLGVTAHPNCPDDKIFYFDPERFSRRKWGTLSGKYMAHGHSISADGEKERYRGSSIATAHLSGRVACLRQALPHSTVDELLAHLAHVALIPLPEIGYG